MSVMDGGEPSLYACPSCSLETYVNEYDDEAEVTGCVICEFKLRTCAMCGDGLSPNDLYGDSLDLCGYCGYKWAKAMERD